MLLNWPQTTDCSVRKHTSIPPSMNFPLAGAILNPGNEGENIVDSINSDSRNTTNYPKTQTGVPR